MSLRLLLLIHGIITLAAGIVLIIAPALIPSTVDITLSKEQYFLSYLVGTSELAIAFLSFAGRNITDIKSAHIIVWTLIIFHAATALVEVYAYAHGLSNKILPNVALRAVISLLFWYYGICKTTHPSSHQ
ncbi:MAG: hypothetical protein EOP51_03665 [Sphingobacteriales bacterium]|nr:MAG: hypothetical protein EOP51_03665 [Sphingobacteriales bacterium]